MKAVLFAGALAWLACMPAARAAYPDRPIHLVVGFSAGGPTDVVARAFAAYAAQALGEPVIVDNKPGANTIVAADFVARSPADGYTLLLGATNHTMIPALYSKQVTFDALRSFTPLCTLAYSPTILVVGPSMPVKTWADFLAALKADPGKHTYATPGIGSSGHFATAELMKMTGTSMNHIPYKGAAQAITDVMSGQVDSSLATLGSVLPQVKAGKLTALAVSASARLPQLPDVPTFTEAGVPGYADGAWYGVLGPANLPAAIQARLESVAQAFAKASKTAQDLDALGMQPQHVCGADFHTEIANEIQEYQELARELGLKSE